MAMFRKATAIVLGVLFGRLLLDAGYPAMAIVTTSVIAFAAGYDSGLTDASARSAAEEPCSEGVNNGG